MVWCTVQVLAETSMMRESAFRSTAVTAGYHVAAESCAGESAALAQYLQARKEDGALNCLSVCLSVCGLACVLLCDRAVLLCHLMVMA
eukprot:COSAG05_NODE_105_length_18793_cov_115.346421_11_plen_88_part_00